jgi:hypothetical protein
MQNRNIFRNQKFRMLWKGFTSFFFGLSSLSTPVQITSVSFESALLETKPSNKEKSESESVNTHIHSSRGRRSRSTCEQWHTKSSTTRAAFRPRLHKQMMNVPMLDAASKIRTGILMFDDFKALKIVKC